MKNTSQENSSENVQKLGEKIKDVKIAMLTTIAANGDVESCPMMTQEVDFDGSLWFFTRKSSKKVEHIEKKPQVNVVYSKPDDQLYVSVSGRAELVLDKAKIDELWTPSLKAWFEKGKEDPEVSLIRVDVESAEYWDTPSSAVVRIVGFAKSVLTGKPAGSMGEHEKLEIH
ncbi:general stress protein [archaeon]|nr:MAG: general stress protein [archaeon]